MSVDVKARRLARAVKAQAAIAPRSYLCGMFGDSRINDNHGTDQSTTNNGVLPPARDVPTTYTRKSSQGWACQVEALCGGRVEFPLTLNFGIAGQTTVQMLARAATDLAEMASRGADAVVILGGTNDPGGSISVDTTNANLAAIVQIATGVGLRVGLITELPRGDAINGSGLTYNPLRDHMNTAQYLRGLHNGKNVWAIDAWSTVGDISSSAASAAGYIEQGKSRDGLHPNGPGNQRIAVAIAAWVNSVFPARSILPINAADVYSPNHPRGAINPNPMLFGNGGVLASGVTGQLADNWGQGTLPSGLSVAASVGTDADGTPYQQFVLSGTPANLTTFDLLRTQINIGSQGLVVGGRFRFVGDMEVLAGATGIYHISPFALSTTFRGSTWSTGPNLAATTWPDQLSRGVFITEECIIPSGATTARLGVEAYFNGSAVSATVRFRRVRGELRP